MSKSNSIDLSFRPTTYWPESENREQRLAHIKGKTRRDMTRNALASGGVSVLNASVAGLARDNLSDESRQFLGAIHPAFMGGEYLPSQDEGAVEIARISLDSTTADQISVRASRTDKVIHFSIVDEYSTAFILSTKESDQPLSLAELINLLESTNHPDEAYRNGMIQCHWNFLYERDTPINEAVDFVSLESPFYGELSDYYREIANSWMKERQLDFDEGELMSVCGTHRGRV
jgi:hypothetical protein